MKSAKFSFSSDFGFQTLDEVLMLFEVTLVLLAEGLFWPAVSLSLSCFRSKRSNFPIKSNSSSSVKALQPSQCCLQGRSQSQSCRNCPSWAGIQNLADSVRIPCSSVQFLTHFCKGIQNLAIPWRNSAIWLMEYKILQFRAIPFTLLQGNTKSCNSLHNFLGNSVNLVIPLSSFLHPFRPVSP